MVEPRVPSNRSRQPPTFAANNASITRSAASPKNRSAERLRAETLGLAGAESLCRGLGFFPSFEFPLQPLQIRSHVGRVLVTKIAILLQSLVDDGFDLPRKLRIYPRHRPWVLV